MWSFPKNYLCSFCKTTIVLGENNNNDYSNKPDTRQTLERAGKGAFLQAWQSEFRSLRVVEGGG